MSSTGNELLGQNHGPEECTNALGNALIDSHMSVAEQNVSLNEFLANISAGRSTTFEYRIEQRGVAAKNGPVVLLVVPGGPNKHAPEITFRLNIAAQQRWEYRLESHLVDRLLTQPSLLALSAGTRDSLQLHQQHGKDLCESACVEIERALLRLFRVDKLLGQNSAVAFVETPGSSEERPVNVTFTDQDLIALENYCRAVRQIHQDAQRVFVRARAIASALEKGKVEFNDDGQVVELVETRGTRSCVRTRFIPGPLSLFQRLIDGPRTRAILEVESDAFQSLKEYLREEALNGDDLNQVKIHGLKNIEIRNGEISFMNMSDSVFTNVAIRNSRIDYLNISGSTCDGLKLIGNHGVHVNAARVDFGVGSDVYFRQRKNTRRSVSANKMETQLIGGSVPPASTHIVGRAINAVARLASWSTPKLGAIAGSVFGGLYAINVTKLFVRPVPTWATLMGLVAAGAIGGYLVGLCLRHITSVRRLISLASGIVTGGAGVVACAYSLERVFLDKGVDVTSWAEPAYWGAGVVAALIAARVGWRIGERLTLDRDRVSTVMGNEVQLIDLDRARLHNVSFTRNNAWGGSTGDLKADSIDRATSNRWSGHIIDRQFNKSIVEFACFSESPGLANKNNSDHPRYHRPSLDGGHLVTNVVRAGIGYEAQASERIGGHGAGNIQIWVGRDRSQGRVPEAFAKGKRVLLLHGPSAESNVRLIIDIANDRDYNATIHFVQGRLGADGAITFSGNDSAHELQLSTSSPLGDTQGFYWNGMTLPIVQISDLVSRFDDGKISCEVTNSQKLDELRQWISQSKIRQSRSGDHYAPSIISGCTLPDVPIAGRAGIQLVGNNSVGNASVGNPPPPPTPPSFPNLNPPF